MDPQLADPILDWLAAKVIWSAVEGRSVFVAEMDSMDDADWGSAILRGHAALG